MRDIDFDTMTYKPEPFFMRPAQTVIYTEEMEPICIINMKTEWYDYLEKQARIRFHVSKPFNFIYPDDATISFTPEIVEVVPHMIIRPDIRAKYLMLTTPNETEALLMDGAFLPGQTRQINEQKRKAFMQGFMSALERM
jgi:hypothetical protein